jgi:hypothetical protein
VASNKYSVNLDYIRAVKLLTNKIHTPIDLVKYWAISGPCLEDCPEIEKVRKKDE